MPVPPFSREAHQTLDHARIGMLALNSRPQPLVNPAAFYYGAGALWMTTSRHAVKLALTRHDPRVAFSVTAPGCTLLLDGQLEAFDPFSISDQIRAALVGPAFYWSVGGYAVRNASFLGGYLIDLLRIPRDWWPQNRVVLRLHVRRWRLLPTLEVPHRAAACDLPGLPEEATADLGEVGLGHLCWRSRSGVTLAPALWGVDDRGPVAMAASSHWPAHHGVGALVIERHHRYRATQMLGACLRGRFACSDGASRRAIESRYQLPAGDPRETGSAVRVDVARVTWWDGFEVRTETL